MQRDARPLEDIPRILSGVAELAARDAGREAVVADRDLLVHVGVGEVVGALGHGAHKDADALVPPKRVDVIANPHQRRVEAERDLAAVGRKVVGDGVLDHLQELLLGVGALDGEPVEQLDHQTGEALERPGNANRGRDFDQHSLGGLDVDLQLPGLVYRRVEESKQTLRHGGASRQHTSASSGRGDGASKPDV